MRREKTKEIETYWTRAPRANAKGDLRIPKKQKNKKTNISEMKKKFT